MSAVIRRFPPLGADVQTGRKHSMFHSDPCERFGRM